MGTTVAVVNQKGGVGKTTTAINLASCLAELGQKVLLADLDPQANATSGLGFVPEESVGVYDLLHSEAPIAIAAVSRETSIPGLYVLPTNSELAGAEVELASSQTRDEVRRCLAPFASEFDFIIIDTPPSLGILTVNCLVAARYLVVPVQCEYYALEGLKQLNRTVHLIQSALNPELQILGLIPTMFDARTLLAQQVLQELRSHFPELVFQAVIPRTIRLSEAPSHGEPIIRYDARSPGARAYRELAVEFLSRFGISVPVVAESSTARIGFRSLVNVVRDRVRPALKPTAKSNESDQRGDSIPAPQPAVPESEGPEWSSEASVEDYLL